MVGRHVETHPITRYFCDIPAAVVPEDFGRAALKP
jgi:hypothetical protein